MERITWDQYFMAQSHLLALRSTCTRLAVGATIVRDKRIIAGGYNGSIAGGAHCTDEGCYVIDGHCVRTIHAEMNAILQCAKFGVPTEGVRDVCHPFSVLALLQGDHSKRHSRCLLRPRLQKPPVRLGAVCSSWRPARASAAENGCVRLAFRRRR